VFEGREFWGDGDAAQVCHGREVDYAQVSDSDIGALVLQLGSSGSPSYGSKESPHYPFAYFPSYNPHLPTQTTAFRNQPP
jgi:hypothetical protein